MRRAGAFLFGVLLFGVLFIALEIALSFCLPDPVTQRQNGSLIQSSWAPWYFYRPSAPPVEPVPDVVEALKRREHPDDLRIAVVGESTAAGFPDDKESRGSFAAYLGVALQQMFPQRPITIINAARSGNYSVSIYDDVRYLSGFRPDVVVFYTGLNEHYRTMYRERELALRYPLLWQIHDLFHGQSRVYAWARSKLRALFERISGPVSDEPAATRSEFDPRGERSFEFFLGQSVRYARSRGSKVLICTVLRNDAWFPPRYPLQFDGAGISAKQRQRYQEGRGAFARGDFSAALQIFESILAAGDDGEWLRNHLARAALFQSLFPDVREHVDAQLGIPEHYLTALNTIIRRVAEQNGATLVDAFSSAREQSRHGYIDMDSVVDECCHLTYRAQYQLSRQIFKALASETGTSLPYPPFEQLYRTIPVDPSSYFGLVTFNLLAGQLQVTEALLDRLAETEESCLLHAFYAVTLQLFGEKRESEDHLTRAFALATAADPRCMNQRRTILLKSSLIVLAQYPWLWREEFLTFIKQLSGRELCRHWGLSDVLAAAGTHDGASMQ